MCTWQALSLHSSYSVKPELGWKWGRASAAETRLYLGQFINMPPLVPSEFVPNPFLPFFSLVWAVATDARSPYFTSFSVFSFTLLKLTPIHHPPLCTVSGGEQTGTDPGVHQQGQLHAGWPGGEEWCAGQRGASLPSHRPPQGAGEVLFTVPAENAG